MHRNQFWQLMDVMHSQLCICKKHPASPAKNRNSYHKKPEDLHCFSWHVEPFKNFQLIWWDLLALFQKWDKREGLKAGQGGEFVTANTGSF